MKKFILFIFIPSFLFSCKEDDDAITNKFNELDHFYQNASELFIEVVYEEGAEPYINSGNANHWDFTDINISALFAGRNKPINVIIPKQLTQMKPILNQGKSSYTIDEIREIANNHQNIMSDEDRSVIFLLFLDGYINRDGEEKTNVLGVSLGNFVIAVFKPVIENISGSILSNPRPSIEQATIVHEIGHAIGLVNAGVDMVEDHHDVQNGKHCTNQDCVMFWLNEGASDMTSFVTSGLFGGNDTPIVFGQECLNDTRNYLN